MRLLTAGSLVRVQHGEPDKSSLGGDFLIYKNVLEQGKKRHKKEISEQNKRVKW